MGPLQIGEKNMKRTLMSLGALAILYTANVAPAFAGNKVIIEQYGFQNGAAAHQKGKRNKMVFHQRGKFNRVLAEQLGNRNLAVSGQVGRRNLSEIYQHGSRKHCWPRSDRQWPQSRHTADGSSQCCRNHSGR